MLEQQTVTAVLELHASMAKNNVSMKVLGPTPGNRREPMRTACCGASNHSELSNQARFQQLTQTNTQKKR